MQTHGCNLKKQYVSFILSFLVINLFFCVRERRDSQPCRTHRDQCYFFFITFHRIFFRQYATQSCFVYLPFRNRTTDSFYFQRYTGYCERIVVSRPRFTDYLEILQRFFLIQYQRIIPRAIRIDFSSRPFLRISTFLPF